MSIVRVKFHRAVVLGSLPVEEWSADRPAVSGLTGKIVPRVGRPELGVGELASSLVFEVRMGSESYDVEVRESNIADITRRPPEKAVKK